MCGLCVEACPTRALTLTDYYELAFTSREEAIWTKEQLLEPPPPLGHRSRGPGGLGRVPLDNVVFWIFAPLSVATAIGMIAVRNSVHAALFLVVNLFTVAVMFLLLDAPFLFAVQIIVYAGAIMVLFLFVIMLLGVDRGDPVGDRLFGQRTIAAILGVAIVAELGTAIRASIGLATRAPGGFDAANPGGNPAALAEVLFRDYLVPVRGDVDPADRGRRRGDGAGPPPFQSGDPARARGARGRRSRGLWHGASRRARIDAGRLAEVGLRCPGGAAMRTPIAYFLLLSAILFALGSTTVLLRRNALRIFMGVELQLNAVNLSLVAFSRMHLELDGQILAFFSMVVAAAEVVVGLAIIVAVFRRTSTTDVDRASVLRG